MIETVTFFSPLLGRDVTVNANDAAAIEKFRRDSKASQKIGEGAATVADAEAEAPAPAKRSRAKAKE